MDRFNKEDLRAMAGTSGSGCVSFFMPTYRVESEFAQNPIRLKNIIREARQELSACGLDDQMAEQILQPALDLLANDAYWLSMSDGLAGFLTKDAARFYRLPIAFEELVVCNSRFHLAPLFPLLAANSKFYLLTLSQNDVRLYHCTQFSISEIETKNIPRSLQEALKYDDMGSGGVGEGIRQGNRLARAMAQQGIHQAHGVDAEDLVHQPHDDLHRFFKQIDAGLHDTIGVDTAPMVLACVEYYVPIFRDVSTYTGLISDQYVGGNPDYSNPKQLQEQAWDVVKPLFQQTEQNARAQFEELYGKNGGMASSDLKEVVPAAVFSRIDTLFVPLGTHVWGHYDADKNKVELHNDHTNGDEDLIDLAAVHTYLNGGTVHAVEEVNMPVKGVVAATFRYQADVRAS